MRQRFEHVRHNLDLCRSALADGQEFAELLRRHGMYCKHDQFDGVLGSKFGDLMAPA